MSLPQPHLWTRWETAQHKLRDVVVQDTDEYAHEQSVLSDYRDASSRSQMARVTIALLVLSLILWASTAATQAAQGDSASVSGILAVCSLIFTVTVGRWYSTLRRSVDSLVDDLNAATDDVLAVFRERIQTNILEAYGNHAVVYTNGDVSVVRDGTPYPARVWYEGDTIQVELTGAPERLQS